LSSSTSFPYTTLFRSHRDVELAALVAELEDLGDVAVRERGGDPRLVEEHLNELVELAQLGQNSLQRHQLPGGARGDREEDLRHRSEEHTSELQSPYDL